MKLGSPGKLKTTNTELTRGGEGGGKKFMSVHELCPFLLKGTGIDGC